MPPLLPPPLLLLPMPLFDTHDSMSAPQLQRVANRQSARPVPEAVILTVTAPGGESAAS